MGLINVVFERKAALDVRPLVGEAACIEQDDAIRDDAVVLQVRVDREDPLTPASLAQIEKTVEPQFDFVVAFVAGEAGQPVKQVGLDAFGGFGDGEIARPTVHLDPDRRKLDRFWNEGSAGEVQFGETFAALAGAVVLLEDLPKRESCTTNPWAARKRRSVPRRGASESGEKDVRGIRSRCGLAEYFRPAVTLSRPRSGPESRWRAFAFDDPVLGSVDDFADAFA